MAPRAAHHRTALERGTRFPPCACASELVERGKQRRAGQLPLPSSVNKPSGSLVLRLVNWDPGLPLLHVCKRHRQQSQGLLDPLAAAAANLNTMGPARCLAALLVLVLAGSCTAAHERCVEARLAGRERRRGAGAKASHRPPTACPAAACAGSCKRARGHRSSTEMMRPWGAIGTWPRCGRPKTLLHSTITSAAVS